jgi:hypothetical protein
MLTAGRIKAGVIVALTTVVTFCLAPSVARAEAPPGGLYQTSCSNPSIVVGSDGMASLIAECTNFYGQSQTDVLASPFSCDIRTLNGKPWSDIINWNGALRCLVSDHADPTGQGNIDMVGKTVFRDAKEERTYWTIDQPTITSPNPVPYPQIKYQAGDTVTLFAGGCAQTGGIGNTWKSYINPQPASDGKYYGEALLPGTGKPLTRIGVAGQGINGEKLLVFPTGDTDLFLSLGYVDDAYGDNGYYSHDDGDNGQCAPGIGTGPAWIVFLVAHPLTPSTMPAPYSSGTKPFDVIYNQLDFNGLPFNPLWHAQKGHLADLADALSVAPDFSAICGPAFSSPNQSTTGSVLADVFLGPVLGGEADGNDWPTSMNPTVLASVCTSQNPSVDQFFVGNSWEGSQVLSLGPICSQQNPTQPIRGHLNWQPVTYSGLIHFSDYSGPFPEDNDFNLILQAGWGLTTGSIKMAGDSSSETFPYDGFLLELDSREVVPHFQTDWWKNFAKTALANDRGAAEEMLGGSWEADDPGFIPPDQGYISVVTGLLGIDGVHDGGISELHPVFSIAVHLPGDVGTSTGVTEHWQIFIRNQGDEGDCSNQIHTFEPEQLNGRDYYISLPWPSAGLSTPSPASVVATVHATPWVSGATVGRTQAAPGLGVYLNFKSPPYAAGGQVPFFGFDGDVTLQYTYPTPVDHRAVARETHASTNRTASNDNDEVEEFPWEKVVEGVKDPAVKAHLLKYFSQKPAVVAHDQARPSIAEASDVTIVGPRSVSVGATLPRRTKTFLDPGRPRRWDDLASASGNPRRAFQAIDVQNIFVLGADGVLSLEDRSLGSGTSQIVDRDVESFEAISLSEVLTLKKNGPLLGNHNALWDVRGPFGTKAKGSCIEGFVWRQASPSDHVCVTPGTRAQAGADNAAGPGRVAAGGRCEQGFVWRQADPTDHVCVSPAVRDQTEKQNHYGEYRVSGPSLTKFIGWPVSRFKAAAQGVTMLDPGGNLWLAAGNPPDTSKPTVLAKDVRTFQVLDPAHYLILTTDDKLQPHSLNGGPEGPVYSNIWAFQQTGDGSLFTISGFDVLRREQPALEIDTNVQSFQAMDANTIFFLKYDGSLTLRRTANVNSRVRLTPPSQGMSGRFKRLTRKQFSFSMKRDNSG